LLPFEKYFSHMPEVEVEEGIFSRSLDKDQPRSRLVNPQNIPLR